MFLGGAARRLIRHAPRWAAVRSPPAAPPALAVRSLHLNGLLDDTLFYPMVGDPAVVRLDFSSARDIVAGWCPGGVAGPEAIDAPPLDEALPAIQAIKRTFQPSLVRRKRKHGFLKRLRHRHGRKILQRRRAKNRLRMAC